MRRRISPSMTKYLYRTWRAPELSDFSFNNIYLAASTVPKCRDYLGVVVRDLPGPKSEIPIDAYCVVCGFKLSWRLVLGKKHVKAKRVIRDATTGTN